MPSRKPRRLVSRIVKVASLGVAGLIAGLLSGCNASNPLSLIPPRTDTGWQSISLAETPSPVPPSHFESHGNLITSHRYLDNSLHAQIHPSHHGL